MASHSSRKQRILVGAGGHGRVLFDLLVGQGMRFDSVLDDEPRDRSVFGERVRATSEADWSSWGSFEFAIGIGNNEIRKEKFDELLRLGGTPMNLIHSTAFISGQARLGMGVAALGNSFLGTDCQVGANVIINTGASVDHDCRIADHVHLCPGVRLSGTVVIGEGVFVGTGTSVANNLSIGAWSVIGAGSVVVKDLPPYVLAYGNPARVVSSLR